MRFFFTLALLTTAACGGELSGNDGGTTTNDGGITELEAGPDGSVCVDVETSAFDTSCTGDTDCIGVTAGGQICSGFNCLCPNASISADSESAYHALLAKVTSGTGSGCGCPLLGTPHCIASQCVFCPNPALSKTIPPGCPDAGN